MSDALRRRGLIKGKAPELKDVPAAPVPPLPATAPTEPIAKQDKKIDLGSGYTATITELSSEKFRVKVDQSGSIPLLVTRDGAQVVDATIEISKDQKARLYVPEAGSIRILEVGMTTQVQATMKDVEIVEVGRTREGSYGIETVSKKALSLDGIKLIYDDDAKTLHEFGADGSHRTHEEEEWVKDIGAYKVWFDPSQPEYILTLGHFDETSKVREVKGTKIIFSDAEVALGAVKGAMVFELLGENVRVDVKADENGDLLRDYGARNRGINLEMEGKSIKANILSGKGPTASTAVNEVWNASKEPGVEILGSTLTDFEIVWNKATGVAHVGRYAPALNTLTGVVDTKTGVKLSNISDRKAFEYKGKNYEINVSKGQLMLTQVQAPQPAPRADVPKADNPSANPHEAGGVKTKPAEPKVEVRSPVIAAAPSKGAEPARSDAKTVRIESPGERIEADDELEGERADEPAPRKNNLITLVVGVALAFGGAYFGVKAYTNRDSQPTGQTQTDAQVVIAPPPAPVIAPPPPVITPPVTPPVNDQQVEIIPRDAGAVTVRDAVTDAPRPRRRSSGGSSGWGNSFEGM